MAFTPPPTPPSASDPANFRARAAAFVAWLVTFAAEIAALGTPGLGGGNLSGDLALAPESNIASAATTNIGTANTNKVAITGTTTITSFGSSTNRFKLIRFTGALTLTHNATSLILPGGANLVTAAGDTAVAVSDITGNWRVVDYQRASGLAVITSPSVRPTGGFLGLGAPTTLIISGGVVTVTGSYHQIDTESAASSDDLDTINGGTAGDLLLIRSLNSARAVTVKDSAGALRLGADRVLSDGADTLLLVCLAPNSWLEIAYGNNA